MEKLHERHRERLRRRFLENGLDSLSDHEVLELLLYFSRPRVNTNPAAHLLLNRFGSLAGVFEADSAELCEVRGIGESSALLIRLMLPIMKRYERDRSGSRAVYDTEEKVGGFLLNHCLGETRERVALLLFDASLHMTDVVTLHEGSVNSSDINPNKVAEIVFSRKASSFILAHNHPGGSAEPSASDLRMTAEIVRSFSGFDVKFREHYIVAGDKYRPILCDSVEYYRRERLNQEVE